MLKIIACKLKLFENAIIDFIMKRSAQKGACAMNRQNYAPCHNKWNPVSEYKLRYLKK